MKKVILAYSGSLDTSVAVAWLREQHGAQVITLTVDVGGGSLVEDVAARALEAAGLKEFRIELAHVALASEAPSLDVAIGLEVAPVYAGGYAPILGRGRDTDAAQIIIDGFAPSLDLGVSGDAGRLALLAQRLLALGGREADEPADPGPFGKAEADLVGEIGGGAGIEAQQVVQRLPPEHDRGRAVARGERAARANSPVSERPRAGYPGPQRASQ